MGEESGEDRSEEDGRARYKQRQDNAECQRNTENLPTQILACCCLAFEELEGHWKPRVEFHTLDMIPIACWEVFVVSDQSDYSASSSSIAEVACMDGCTANEGVSAIGRLCEVVTASRWPSNHKVLILQRLVANGVRLEYLFVGAAGGASESVGGTIERPAEIAVDAAVVTPSPRHNVSML